MASIHSINVDNTLYDVKATHYATCNTVAATAAKVATIQNGGFALETGVKVSVKFTYENNVGYPTLNINNTGAKSIYWRGSPIQIDPLDINKYQIWKANQVVDFVYDGTQWNIVGSIDRGVGISNSLFGEIFNDYLQNSAAGFCSHAEGYDTNASGIKSHAEGNNTEASGDNSHAEGSKTKASGDNSHAEGSQREATGFAAHIEGGRSSDIGGMLHNGYEVASGDLSHAEGASTGAAGKASHAEGVHTYAGSDYQHVQGVGNIIDEENVYAHIVGNGKFLNASNGLSRSNAHALDWDGNAYFAGDVYTGVIDWNSPKVNKLALKYNEGILTYQDDPELEGKTYCVDIPDLTELKVGMELTIIPHVTSVITGPSLSINGGEKVGMRVMAATTNSSFNATRPDFMNAGAPVKLMYIERTTVGAAAYTVLADGKIVSAINTGTEANGYYMIITETDDYEYYTLYSKDNDILERLNLDGAHYESEYLVWPENYTDSSVIPAGTYTFSNGTDAATTCLWRIMNSVRVNAEALMSNNAMGGGMYACTPGKANEKILWNTPAQVGMDINKNSVFAAASANGTVYTVNEVPNLTSLYRGLELTILPSRSSASTSATLNVNGLGAKTIRCKGTGTSGGSYNPKKNDFITANKPTKVKYDGTYWILDLVHVNAETLFGQVPISNGGTGASSASGARTALSVPSLAQFNALLARVEALEAGGSGTITFYINTGDEEISYRAEEGMTWSQFINSSYNESIECPSCGGEVSNFERDGTYIHFNLAQSGCLMEARENDDYSYVLSTGGDYIELSDVIIDNTTYEIGFP